VVNHLDYLTLKRNWGFVLGGTWPHADFDADGKVAYPDYVAARDHFGQSLPDQRPPAAAVPTPGGETTGAAKPSDEWAADASLPEGGQSVAYTTASSAVAAAAVALRLVEAGPLAPARRAAGGPAEVSAVLAAASTCMPPGDVLLANTPHRLRPPRGRGPVVPGSARARSGAIARSRGLGVVEPPNVDVLSLTGLGRFAPLRLSVER